MDVVLASDSAALVGTRKMLWVPRMLPMLLLLLLLMSMPALWMSWTGWTARHLAMVAHRWTEWPRWAWRGYPTGSSVSRWERASCRCGLPDRKLEVYRTASNLIELHETASDDRR